MTFTRRDAILLLLLAGLIALFFWRILTPNQADRAQFPVGDFTDQFYAYRLYEAQSLAAGRLPLWSENFNSGHPFLADIQAAVFYPPALANMLLNVALFGPNFSLFALELEALLHFWLAGAFTYLFARRVIAGRTGALAAALVFTFGGYLTSYPPLQLAILETATWLPLVLYFLDRAMGLAPEPVSPPRSREPIAFLLAGIVLGVSLLAGHPQTFVFILATCATYYGFRVYSARKRLDSSAMLKLLLSFGLVLVVAVGVAAVQLIPTLEYQRLSTREALSFREAAAGFPTLDLLQFIFPGFTTAFASPLYVGILPFWLAVLALARRRRERTFWGVLGLGALTLALGFYVFAYAIVYLFAPGATLFREQERLALVVSFALAMLAGFGLEDVVADARTTATRKWFWLLPTGMAVSFALLITFFSAAVEHPSGRLAFLGDRAGLMLLLFGLVAVLVWAHMGSWLSRRLFTGLALGLILFDLFSVNEPANKADPTDRYGWNPLVEIVQQDKSIFRVANQGKLPPHFGIAYQLEEISGISPLRLAHYDQLLSLPVERLWPLLGVKYAFAAAQGTTDGALLGRDGDTRLLRLNDPLPRAWLAGGVQVESDDQRALDVMRSADFDTKITGLLASSAPFAPNPLAASGTATVTAHEPERIAVDLSAPADGILVIAENYYPGWTARVDGADVDLLRADVSLRAVPIHAGVHHVEMVYDPLSLKLGAAITALTFILSVGLTLLRRKRRPAGLV